MDFAAVEKTIMVLTLTGKIFHEAVSFTVFSLLDLLDFVLCFAYKVVDFFIEAEWKPCYCTSAREVITSSGKILVSEQGESKIVRLSSSKLELEEISDTLYNRSSLLSEVSKLTVNELKRIKVEKKTTIQSRKKIKNGMVTSKFTINSAIVEMLQEKVRGQQLHPLTRWSDCHCEFCNSWMTHGKETLFVRAEGPKDGKAKEVVLFIHGFISSSAFWTETLFPNFSNAAKSTYRLFAIDLLGFGRSPKPTDSLYTLREHLDMIEQSVLEPYRVKSFHIVAHSLGCILALALAVKHPDSVKSLTLLAPPYYSVPKSVQAAQHVLRTIAPRRVWPPMAFGASVTCWYEHITRTVCLLMCKNHWLWEFLTHLVTRNRVWTCLVQGFFCHTHNASWHTLHNIIFGAASKLDGYLDTIRDHLNCDVNIFHGKDDEVIPVECSKNVKEKIPRAHVKVIDNKDHITIVVGRQKAFARELEEIWKRASD